MLSDKGNPRTDNLLWMVGHIKKSEGVVLRLAEGDGLYV